MDSRGCAESAEEISGLSRRFSATSSLSRETKSFSSSAMDSGGLMQPLKTASGQNPYGVVSSARKPLTQEERDAFILEHCGIVKSMALRLASRLPPNVAADDLINAGVLGLMDAVDKFDPDQGISFEAYARIRIRGAMLDEIRAMDWVPRSLRQKSSAVTRTYATLEQRLGRSPTDEEMAAQMELKVADYFKLLDEIKGISVMPEDVYEAAGEGRGGSALMVDVEGGFRGTYQQELRKFLAEAIGTLSKKEQQLLALYYYEELTMKEIGVVMDYTESRISQLHTKAMIKLRARLARRLKGDDLPYATLTAAGDSEEASSRKKRGVK